MAAPAWMRRSSLENSMADPDPAGRLQALLRQRSRVQGQTQFLNTSPLGETSPQAGQEMVDLSQSIAALGQKVANPTKGVQFAPEPRVSTTPNALQSAWGMDRARTGAAANLAGATQARDLEIGNTQNELAIQQQMDDPTFGDMDAGRARYAAGPRRTASLARQYSGSR
jgi:hypothetical protein